MKVSFAHEIISVMALKLSQIWVILNPILSESTTFYPRKGIRVRLKFYTQKYKNVLSIFSV